MFRMSFASMTFAITLVGCDGFDFGSISTESSSSNIESNAKSGSSPADENFAVDSGVVEELAFLKVASPRATEAILEGLARKDKPLTRYGIDDSAAHLMHFLSQSATETGGFRKLAESTSYSAERLLEVFPSRVSVTQAAALARRPRETANHVYGDRLGNRKGTDDGWNFRGSGYLQLTGRENFARMGNRLKLPIISHPDSVRKPLRGLDASLEFWVWRGVDRIAESGSVAQVRRAVNGGTIGLAEAEVWHAVIVESYRSRNGVRPETGGRGMNPVDAAVASALSEFGFLEGPIAESTFRGGRYASALADFQRSRGLKVTGEFDTDTLYAITDPTGKFEDE